MKTVWERLSVELGHQPYPLTFILVEKVSAISRKARYRAHQQHTKLPEDVPITNPTLLALQDAYRAVNWGLGPPTRAKEMRLDLRDQLQLKIDSDHIGVTLTKRGQDPIGGFVHLGGLRQISCSGKPSWRCWRKHIFHHITDVVPVTSTNPLDNGRTDNNEQVLAL